MTLNGTRDALNDYRKVAISDNMAKWCFFAPAATLNFGFSPLWLRVPVVAAVSFLWTMVLSYRRGSIPVEREEPSRFSEARWRELSMQRDYWFEGSACRTSISAFLRPTTDKSNSFELDDKLDSTVYTPSCAVDFHVQRNMQRKV